MTYYEKPEDRCKIDMELRDMSQCITMRCVNPRQDDGYPLCDEHLMEAATRGVKVQRRYDNRRFLDIEKKALEQFKAGKRISEGLDEDGWIYFLRSDGLIKIGFSKNIGRRLRQYPPSADVLLVMPGNRTIETHLHRRFKLNLKRGREWFEETEWIDKLIDQQLAIYGPPAPELSTERFAKAKFQKDLEPYRQMRADRDLRVPPHARARWDDDWSFKRRHRMTA